MVVHNVIYTQEPNAIEWWIVLDHVTNDYLLYVYYLMREELLKKKNGYLRKASVSHFICHKLHLLRLLFSMLKVFYARIDSLY